MIDLRKTEILSFKETHREDSPSNKTQVLTKSMNITFSILVLSTKKRYSNYRFIIENVQNLQWLSYKNIPIS